MSDKMLVTQALDERDLLVKKIETRLLRQALLIQSNRMKIKYMQSGLQRMSMLNRRNQPISRFLI